MNDNWKGQAIEAVIKRIGYGLSVEDAIRLIIQIKSEVVEIDGSPNTQ